MKSAGIPYPRFLGIGAVLIVIGVVDVAVNRESSALGFVQIAAGFTLVALGFVEKKRGAPKR